MKFKFQKYLFSFYPKRVVESINLLESEVEKGAFTAWSFASNEYIVSAFWADEYPLDENFHSLNLHPVFDLASLTKPLFINLFLMVEYKKKYFDFVNAPISELIQQKNLAPNSLHNFIKNNPGLSTNSFLSHKTGILPWCWMGCKSAGEIIEFILKNKVKHNKDESYSDLNYFILARIFELLFVNSNEKFSWTKMLEKTNVALDADFKHASIQPATKCIPYFPYTFAAQTEATSFDYGFVHDTNANIFSSLGAGKNIVSGHAGLFGSVTDVVKAVIFLIKDQAKCFHKEKNKLLSRFIYGFDTPSSAESTAGMHEFEKNKNSVFGHLGYTGTSFWLNPESEDFHILLTNRTATRKIQENDKCLRIYCIENRVTQEKKIYSRMNDKVANHLAEEILSLSHESFKKSSIILDKNKIPDYRNLSSLRRQIGLNLWDV